MAKVKAASRKSKKSPATKKNIKGETTTCNVNENEQYAYLNDYYEIQSKIRLCFVKIKREKRLNNAAVSRGGGVDGGNGDGCTKDDENGSETQAQCTNNEIVCKTLEDRVNDVTAIDKTIPCVGTREMKGNILDKSSGESEVFELSSPSKETSCQSLGSEITLPPKLRRCKVRIKRMRKIQTVYTTAKFSNKFSQKCRVKIPKTPMPLQRSAPAAAGEAQKLNKYYDIPARIRLCCVKLKRDNRLLKFGAGCVIKEQDNGVDCSRMMLQSQSFTSVNKSRENLGGVPDENSYVAAEEKSEIFELSQECISESSTLEPLTYQTDTSLCESEIFELSSASSALNGNDSSFIE